MARGLRMLPYYGSKYNLAPTIVGELGQHQSYWEPFGGGMAVILNKPACPKEVVNDLHGDVINLARVLASDKWEILHCRWLRTLWCEPLFRESAKIIFHEPCVVAPSVRDVDDANIDRAYWYLVYAWFGMGGTVGLKSSCGTSLRVCHGASRSSYVRSMDARIARIHERLRNVDISHRDAFGILGGIRDERGTAIYCDPPYVEKSSSYKHDFADGDHERLAEALRRFERARVVVSYYEHPLLDELYEGWTKVRLMARKNMASAERKRELAPETLLINGPSFSGGFMWGEKDMARCGF